MTNSSSDASQNTARFSWSTFRQRILQAFGLLSFGIVAILLWHINGSVDAVLPDGADPFAFLGGTIALVLLTVMGVPAVAATAAGVAIWLTIQNFL